MLFFDSQNNLVEQQLSTNPVVSGRVVAIDWHQVTDTYRESRFKAFRADWETGELPQSVLDVYHRTAHKCGQFDKVIILSHIEKSEKNLAFLLKSTRVNRLPVDLVFVSGTRTGSGGKAAVLQAPLGGRSLARSILLDDNLQVCSEILILYRWHSFEHHARLNEGSTALADLLGTPLIIDPLQFDEEFLISDRVHLCLSF